MHDLIRTPDQRLRVFISSTLKELASERSAVQQAVERLHLTPVMFEQGARPHPAADLYHAYLKQSHIFIGVYFESYGWVAPDMQVSGLEDEYLLSAGKPQLIYIKNPAPDRQPELQEFLGRIKKASAVSYKYFSDANELGDLVADDLALLLTERFELSAIPADTHSEIAERPRHNLPAPVTPFVGRESQVEEVADLLRAEDIRLINLTGPGGAGKTRLALQAASRLIDHFPDGVYFISLDNIDDPSLVLSKTAQTLEVREGGSQPLQDNLKTFLRDKSLLLLLDNFEQVAEAASYLAEWLEVAPALHLLVTSRALLNLRGEREYEVPALALPASEAEMSIEQLQNSEAARLFLDRAQAASPRFHPADGDAPAIAEICRRLDGLPLALELAAARVKLFPPKALLKQLDASLDLLTGGSRDLPARQQTLRDAIDWSFNLLSPSDQVLFSRLSIFVGSFSLDAAEKVCVLGKGLLSQAILDGIASLINNSLLEQVDLLNGQPRFRMLDTIRAFALDLLDASGERPTLERQRLAFYTDRMNETYLLFGTPKAGESLSWVDAEHDNLRAALSWCVQDPESEPQGPFLISTMVWYWYRRGFLIEGRRWAERIVNTAGAQKSLEGRGLAVFTVAALALWQGDLNNALENIEQAVEITKQVENPFAIGVTQLFHGTILVNQGKDRLALPFLEEARLLYQNLGMRWDYAVTTIHMANAALGLGELEHTEAYLRQAEPIAEEIGEDWLLSFLLNNFGEFNRLRGDYDTAEAYYQRSEAILRQMGDKGDLARLIHNHGYIALHQDNPDLAEEYFNESLAMFRKLANQRGLAECLAGLAASAAHRGEFPRAAVLIAAAESLLAATGGAWWPADRSQIAQTHALVESNLNESEREQLAEQGNSMDLGAALSYAFARKQ